MIQASEREQQFAEELERTQRAFETRVIAAYRLQYKPGKRSILYQSWRKDYVDAIARESAKFAESLIAGTAEWPNWFRTSHVDTLREITKQ